MKCAIYLSERIEYDYDPATGKKSAERFLASEGGTWVVKKSESFAYDIEGRLIRSQHPDLEDLRGRRLFSRILHSMCPGRIRVADINARRPRPG